MNEYEIVIKEEVKQYATDQKVDYKGIVNGTLAFIVEDVLQQECYPLKHSVYLAIFNNLLNNRPENYVNIKIKLDKSNETKQKYKGLHKYEIQRIEDLVSNYNIFSKVPKKEIISRDRKMYHSLIPREYNHRTYNHRR